MTPFHAVRPLRVELQELLELSVRSLDIYGTLLRHFNALEEDEAQAWLRDPQTEALRDSFCELLPPINGPYLSLPARTVLYNIVAQTAPDEDKCLCVALTERFALQLEPYLRSAEMDPDQARYLGPILEALDLQKRPTAFLVEARRASAAATTPDRLTGILRRARR